MCASLVSRLCLVLQHVLVGDYIYHSVYCCCTAVLLYYYCCTDQIGAVHAVLCWLDCFSRSSRDRGCTRVAHARDSAVLCDARSCCLTTVLAQYRRGSLVCVIRCYGGTIISIWYLVLPYHITIYRIMLIVVFRRHQVVADRASIAQVQPRSHWTLVPS